MPPVATTMVALRMPDQMKEELERRAASNERTLSQEIRYLLNLGLAGQRPANASDPVVGSRETA